MASPMLKRSLISGAGLILAAALFFSANILADATLRGQRLDLTQGKLYTLSDGTRQVIRGIGEPISLRFYFSERLGQEIPSYAVYAARIREMLQEYAAAAPGKIRLQIIDPLPFSDEEDRAVGFGLQGVPVNQGGDLVYFGLAGTNAADREEVISFFQPERERFLEYDLTRLIFQLADSKKKVVGVMSTLPLQGEFRGPRAPAGDPWVVYQQIQNFFEVKWLDTDIAAIPDDVTTLMVVHPRGFTDKTQYAIDQFVMKGGRVLLFVDPHAEGEMGRPGPAAQTGLTGSNLPKLMTAWGIEMPDGKFAGDRLAARRVAAGADTRVRGVDYVAWLTMRDQNFNKEDVLTAQLTVVQMASAGILKPKEGAGTTVTPLIQTSPQAMEIEVDKIKTAPNPVELLAAFKAEDKPLMLAARITGPVKTAFPDGPPVEKKEEEPKAEGDKPAEGAAATPAPAPAAPAGPPPGHLAQSAGPANIIVFSDTDMLEDRFWVQVQDFFGQKVAVPSAQNGDVAVNALDNLGGANGLIGLRGRGVAQRPFKLIQDIQQDAELRFRAKERELTEKLKDAERKLSELQQKDQGGKAILTAEQQQAIESFRAEILGLRRELRGVQLDLRKDIQRLETWIKFLNIAAIPILIAVVAVILGWARIRRRRAPRIEPGAPAASAGGAA